MSYTAAQLTAAYTAANNGIAPDSATEATLTTMAAQSQAGTLSDIDALTFVINSAQDDVQVAVQAYQFFTGKSPSQAGFDYLTNSTANPNDLNDPYYLQFNLENRYINFAANLGLFGEGAAAFAAAYGGLTFAQAVDLAYETVIGTGYAAAAGINISAAKADILSRQAAFLQTAMDRSIVTAASSAAQKDLATKAALIGYLLVEGIKADVGVYAASANNFVAALVDGAAMFNVDVIATYAPLGGGLGSPVAPGANLPSATTVAGPAGATLNGLAPNSTVRVTSSLSSALVVVLKDSSGTSDSLTVALVGSTISGRTVPVLTTPGVETLNLVTVGGLGSRSNTVTLTDTASLATVKITGGGPLSLSAAIAHQGVTLDGSAATGSLRLDASPTTLGFGVNLVGGAASDTLVAGLAAFTSVRPVQELNGGRGGDLIVLGAAHATRNLVVYRSGGDSLLDLTPGASAGASSTDTPNTMRMDVVTGFVIGQDAIDLTAFGLSALPNAVADKGQVGTSDALAALTARADFFTDAVGLPRSIAQVHVGPDTYLFVDANRDGVFSVDADLAVKFVGLAQFLSTDLLR